jgi:hypothetical protein
MKRRVNARERAAADRRSRDFFYRIEAGDPAQSRMVQGVFDAAPEQDNRKSDGDLAAPAIDASTGLLPGLWLVRCRCGEAQPRSPPAFTAGRTRPARPDQG